MEHRPSHERPGAPRARSLPFASPGSGFNPAASPLRLAPNDACWPPEFEPVEPAPEELWALGRLELLQSQPAEPRRLAIVGTRSPSPYGLAQAEHFGRSLARLGICVVSGMARGIDTAAHSACLQAGGDAIAVLGSGVDRPWPEGPLARSLATEGLLLSEYAPGTPPRRHHFPLRNRLIAALAPAVLVIEAAYRSGSLITAQWALDLGRDVLALPGPVDQPGHRGCHRLIRQGALLVESPYQVLEALGWTASAPDPAVRGQASPESSVPGPERGSAADSLEWQILAALHSGSLSPADLARQLSRPLSEVLTLVVELELAGALVRTSGGAVRRAE